MAIKASSTITLSFMVDVKAVYRYYKLQSSTLSAPSAPTTNPPSGWVQAEPTYTSGSTNTLYTVDLTVFTNDTWLYTPVSKSSSYEAAKDAYNKAVSAQGAANSAQDTANTANDKIDNLQVGGRNLCFNSATWNFCAHQYGASFSYELLEDIGKASGKTIKITCTAPGNNGFFSFPYGNNTPYPSMQGEVFTYGMDIKASRAITQTIGCENGGLEEVKLTTEWTRYTKTFTVSNGTYQAFVFYMDGWEVGDTIYISDFKYEKGSKATDYTEAPEDIQNQINTSKKLLDDIASDSKLTPSEKQEVKREWLDIDTEYNKYKLQCTNYSVSYDAYKNAYDALNSYLNTTNSGVIFNMNSTTDISRDAFNNKFAAYYSCKVDMLNALEYAKAKKEADNVVVGGRNLLYTDLFEVGHWWYNGGEAHNNFFRTKDYFNGRANTEYTISLGNIGDGKEAIILPYENGVAYTEQCIVVCANQTETFKFDKQWRLYFQIGENLITSLKEVFIPNIKLELGNKATDYTSAPEDVQTGIDNAQTSADKALSTATAAQASANGKNTVFYVDGKNDSNGKPTVVPTGTTDCPLKVNDLWFNTGEDNCSYRWNGSQWERKAYGNAAIDTLDAGKITTGQMDAARINVDDLTAFGATIGGFGIRNGALYSTKVGMGRSGYDWAFWAGSDTSDSAPFRVGHAGKLWATNSEITGNISGSTITGSTITSTDGNGIIKLANTALTFGAVGETEDQIKIYLDNKGLAAIKTPWFHSARGQDYDMYFDSASFTDITWSGKMYGSAKFNNNIYVGYKTLSEKSVFYENTTASSGTTNRASHKVKVYGANANSTTAFGVYDYKNENAVLVYQDGAQPNGSTSPTKKLIVASGITFTATGTVSSSDERLKHDFKPLDRYEGFFYDLKPCSFKYNNGNSDRDWIGAKAQEVEKALIKNGLTTKDFAGYVQYSKTEADDDWDGYEDERGLRYENFIFLNTHMIQKQKVEIEDTKKELEATKKELEDIKKELEDIKTLLKAVRN